MFNVKNSKKIIVDNRKTLDVKHKEIIKEFQLKKNKLGKYRKDYQKIVKTLEQLNSVPKSELSQKEIDQIIDVKIHLKDLEKEIKKIESNEELNEYFIETGDILNQYYESIENPNGIKKSNSKLQLNYSSSNYNLNSSRNIFDYFSSFEGQDNTSQQNKIKHSNNSIDNLTINPNKLFKNNLKNLNKPSKNNPNQSNNEKDNSNSNTKQEYYGNRGDLLEAYMNIVESDNMKPIKIENYEMCPYCHVERYQDQSESLLICQKCGYTSSIIIDSDKPSYKDPPPEISYFAYKRINHFNEILAQFQAKETTEIPQEVFDKILLEIKKERIKNMALLSNDKVKSYLKKLRLNKHYEHVPYIINRLNGLPPPYLNPEVEEKLRSMFRDIQGPFAEVCPRNRKNFLSYFYVAHKFVERLGLEEFKSCFPLLKSRDKLYEHDKIWKGICERLGWEFIPSI